MKTRSRKGTVSSGTNSANKNFNEKFKDSTQTENSPTNNEPNKNSTLVAKTPFAEISNTINRNGNARDSAKRKISNVHHPSEYSDSPILVSRFKKNIENKLPKTGHTNLKENCSVSEINDFQSPIIKTRKIKNVTSTPFSIPDPIEETPVISESKSNNTKVGLVKEDSTTKIIKGRKRHEKCINENSAETMDAPIFDSLPATARRSMRNKSKITPSTINNVDTDVKGLPKTSVVIKKEKTTTKRIPKVTQKSNPVTRNTRKESKDNSKTLASEEKTPISSLRNNNKQTGTRQMKGRKNVRNICKIESMSVNEAATSDNKLATRKTQITERLFPKNKNADTKTQKIANESVQVNDKEIGVASILPSPSANPNSSDKPQARLSKREQLALALRQGKLKSTLIANSSNKGIIYEPAAAGNKTGSKQKNVKTIIPKTEKVFPQNKSKSAKLLKMQSVSSKEDPVDGKTSKITVQSSPSVSCAKKGPIYFNVSKSSSKRKVLKTRKSISDAYDLSVESDLTPNPIIKKKKPKSRCVKSKVAPKKQNKFTVLTTDPNFEKRFQSAFAVKSFYGKSGPNINENSSYKNSNPLCNTDFYDRSVDSFMPIDEDIPEAQRSPLADLVMSRDESSLSAIAPYPPKASDDHLFLRPSDHSKKSNGTLNSSIGSNKSTPDTIRQMSSKNFLGTSTPYTNNSKMSSSAGAYCTKLQISSSSGGCTKPKTVAEDRAAYFGFDEVDGEEEELQIGLSLPLVKNIQHLLASTGNYSRNSLENNSCIPKSDDSNHNNWSVSQIENAVGCSPKLKPVATKSKKKVKENIELNGSCLFEDIEDEKRIEKSQIVIQFESVENKNRRDSPSIVLSPEKSFVVPANKTYNRQSLDASRAALFEKISGGLPTDDEDESEPIKKKRTKNILSKTKEFTDKKKESVVQSYKVTKSTKRKVDKESTLSTTSHLSNSTMNVSKKSKRNEKTIEDWASSMMGHFGEIDESALLVECDQ